MLEPRGIAVLIRRRGNGEALRKFVASAFQKKEEKLSLASTESHGEQQEDLDS